MKSSDYPKSEWQPRLLSQEEVNEPEQVLVSFFDMANLPEARELLSLWLEATVTGSYNKKLTRRERNDIFFFYRQVEKLVEAAHLVAQKTA